MIRAHPTHKKNVFLLKLTGPNFGEDLDRIKTLPTKRYLPKSKMWEVTTEVETGIPELDVVIREREAQIGMF